ncbi:MAG: GIY-YIG nuclease family protein [Thermoflavifilum sp.]|uniref:GIY-YIG nuclease family protein n=1 Tax=Thermoflavifilum sp. TaxID=1968839 RepID=UPI0018A39E96|nr:MAG: GIY-YIG nuclease family protein [Thermoflavifilum sp.]
MTDGYYVYVLKSEDYPRFYIGITNDIHRRLSEHNQGHTRSTRMYRPWHVVWVEKHPDRKEARKRESYLKSGVGRAWIQSFLVR